MEDRTCTACGQDFAPTFWAQRYCPPTESDRAKGRRSQCAKRAGNLQQRGGDVTRLQHKVIAEPFDCEQCGMACVPGSNVAPHASRFCGYDCKATWHSTNPDGYEGRRRHAEAVEELLSIACAEPSRADTVAHRRSIVGDPCAYCGTPSTTPPHRRLDRGVDHIVPTSAGGDDDWTNYAASCLPVSREYHDVRRMLWHAA